MKFCFTNRITNLTELTQYVNSYLLLAKKKHTVQTEQNIADIIRYDTLMSDWISNLYTEVDKVSADEMNKWLTDNGSINYLLNEWLAEHYSINDDIGLDIYDALISPKSVQLKA